MRTWLALLAGGCMALNVGASPAGVVLPAGAGMKDVVLPVYAGQAGHPVAILRVERFGLEYQKRGFFRIGVLPIMVLDDVTLEVLDAERLREVIELAFSHPQFRGHKSAIPVEVRRFRFRCKTEPGLELSAKTLRPVGHGRWALSGVIIQRPGAQPIELAEAFIGPGDAGDRRLAVRNSTGVHQLLSSKPNEKPIKTHENP